MPRFPRMPKKIAFIISGNGTAYDLSARAIQRAFAGVHKIDVISNYDIPRRTSLGKYDALFVMPWWMSTVTEDVKRIAGPPRAAMVGSHIAIDSGAWPLLNDYDLVFCTSQKLQASLLGYGITAPVVKDLFDPKIFYPSYRTGNVNFTIGWVGRPNRKVKRFQLFEELSGWACQRGFIAKVANLTVKTSAKSRVSLAPDVTYSKMGHFYRGLECLLITSESEGVPRACVEAMLCGTPVIGSDVGVLSDLNAIVLPEPLTVDALKTALLKLKDKPLVGLRRSVSKTASRHYGYDRVYSEWKRIFSAL